MNAKEDAYVINGVLKRKMHTSGVREEDGGAQGPLTIRVGAGEGWRYFIANYFPIISRFQEEWADCIWQMASGHVGYGHRRSQWRMNLHCAEAWYLARGLGAACQMS